MLKNHVFFYDWRKFFSFLPEGNVFSPKGIFRFQV